MNKEDVISIQCNTACVYYSLVHIQLCDRHGLKLISLLSPWNSPGKYTGMNRHSLLQGISLTQGLSPSLLHCRQTVNRLSHQGNPQCNSTQTLKKKKWNPSVYNVGPWSYHAKRKQARKNKVVVTREVRGEWRVAKMDKKHQLYDYGWKLNLGWWPHCSV